jgi:hypothetical protein
MKYITIFILLFVGIVFIPNCRAAENNKFGIHLAVPAAEQIKKAAELVNANGGDWGYITLVIQEDDRNHDKWQEIFDNLRNLHLIPIIRIATRPVGALWRRPTVDDAGQWADFLNGLNWVVKDRYIVLFNEPNHSQEWGGKVDPEEFARVTQQFATKLKSKNSNFFIMLGGLDASAPASAPNYADEAQFLKSVIDTIGVTTFNNLFSGLASHSYPNPGFAGSPSGSGRGSVRTYQWELSLLESWGVKSLPVFITETGWDAHQLSRDAVASNYKYAYENIWEDDDRVKAVTPFVLDYQGDPFLGFSWKMVNNDEYYSQFYTVQQIPKTKGRPEIIEKGSIENDLPHLFVVNSNYHFKLSLSNSGQGIWDEKDGYKLVLENFDSGYFFSDLTSIEPNQSSDVDLFFKSRSIPGKKDIKIALYKEDKKVLESSVWLYEVVPLPKLDFRVSLFPRLKHKGTDFEIQIFDEKEQLVFKKKNVEVEHAKGSVGDIKNITLDKKYRVVILKPFYLPRQTFERFGRGINTVTFEKMYPIDFNKDGKFDLADIWSLIIHPSFISLLFP